jgi:hypothetical protein
MFIRVTPGDGLARTEAEIVAEKAAALRRIAGTLEDLLADLEHRAVSLASLEGLERVRGVAAYNEVLQRAKLYRWYLEVQWEAVGLRRHDRLDELYPVPSPLQD